MPPAVKFLRAIGLESTARLVKLRWINRYDPAAVRQRRQVLQFYSQFIKRGDLCFDIGANFGNRTAPFVELGARVICVEPQQTCLQLLTALFGKNKNVVIVGTAVADREGYAELGICKDDPAISTMSERWKTDGRFKGRQWTATQQVPVTTLDALIQKYGLPAFCKIDVEGFEVSVLKGLSQPIPFISFEYSREFLADAQTCMMHLATLGQVCFNATIGESMQLMFSEWLTAQELYARLAAIEDKLLWGDIYARFPES